MHYQSVLFPSRTLAALLLIGSCSVLPLFAAGEAELKDDAGKTIIKYVVQPPESMPPASTTDPAQQLGLILCFPEHDRPVGDELYPVRQALTRLGLRDRYVLLAGGPQARKFGPADHEPIEKMIAWALKTYPINPRRIYMYGKGEGGKISGEFAMLHPKLVTASVTYSWGWWKMPSELTEAIDPLGSAPEFYMVLGLRDLSYHLTTVRDAYSRVNAKGYHVIYREFADLGARTYHQPSNDDAIAWITRLRNKNVPLSMGERAILKRYATATPAIGRDGFFDDLALVGGSAAGTVVQKLLASGDPKVRAAAAETCSHAVFDEATMIVLGRLLTDTSLNVRASTLRALAMNANWRSEAAQHALIAAATNSSDTIEPAVRVGAADAIVYATRLQLKGVRQDPAMFKALVALLDDNNEELRTMAGNTLAPIRDSDFRGDLGRPEQKAPNGGWTAWLNEVTAKAAGYLKDYEVCGWGAAPSSSTTLPGNRSLREPVDLYCMGGASLLGQNLATGKPARKDPAAAFKYTLQAAEQGYLPAEAAAGMMYAIGKGVEQSFPDAAKWWTKAAEGGHVLAAMNASMVYRGGSGVPADPAKSEKWAKFAAEHSGHSAQ
jgi:hypothetical protein